MKIGKFFIMKNGDVINTNEIIYIHLSKTEEKAFIYIKGLFHSKVEDYDKWLNRPCPKCGENLLTDDDYRNVQFLLAMEKIANEIYPKIEDDESIVKATIDMNGTGNINIAIDDNNKKK